MDQLEAFRILASEDRQIVLRELFDQEGEASIDDISRQVASERNQTSPDNISDETFERAKIRLVHSHLPRMAEENVIEKSDNMATLRSRECVIKVLEAAEELETQISGDLPEHLPHSN